MDLELKRLAELAGFTYPADFTAPTGTAGAGGHNIVNNMGDNPLKDPSLDEEDMLVDVTPVMLDKLLYILKGTGISDHDIAIGDFPLSPEQAARLCQVVCGVECDATTATSRIRSMCEMLSERMVGRGKRAHGGDASVGEAAVNEFELNSSPTRYTYVVDMMGNVMVTDVVSARELYLQGSEATQLIGAIEQATDQAGVQDLLAQLAPMMEQATVGSSIGFGSLQEDLDNMRQKLQATKAQATKTGDLSTAFATDLFQEEVERLAFTIKDYLSKNK